MPTFRSGLYPYGYSGNLVGTRTGSNRGKTWVNPATGRTEPVPTQTARTGTSNRNQWANQLIRLMNQGQNITRQEYNVPWQNYLSMLNQPLNSESRLNEAYRGWQQMAQNPGMTSNEANMMYGEQSDMQANALMTALNNIARSRPSGIGATVEAEGEARDTATQNLLAAKRAIEIEKLKSQREGKQTALSGLSSTANAMANASQTDYTTRMGILDALQNMAMIRQQADLTGQQSAGELLAQVVAGNIPSDLIGILSRGISSQNTGYGYQGAYSPVRGRL